MSTVFLIAKSDCFKIENAANLEIKFYSIH